MLANLKRLYDWLPIIWNDRDWDYGYLLNLMKYKLSRMEKVIGSKKSFAAGWEHRKVEIATAQLLISKIEEDPDDEWTQYYDSHVERDFDVSMSEEERIALNLSFERDQRNWHALWKYCDKYMRGFWD